MVIALTVAACAPQSARGPHQTASPTPAASRATSPSDIRDWRWRQDIDVVAQKLPLLQKDGLGALSRSAWAQAAADLDARVPRLNDGEILVGLERMVARLGIAHLTVLSAPQGVGFAGSEYPISFYWLADGP